MKLLLTGLTGFIGQRLAALIRCRPELLANSVALSSGPVPGFHTVPHHDYRLSPGYFSEMGLNEVEAVIHLGAYIPKKPAEADHIDATFSNMSGTKALLESLPATVRKFIFISTVDVYGLTAGQIISEETPRAPATLYGLSKLYGERMTEAYCRSRGIAAQILRLGHIYGPGEDGYQKIIPVTIKKVIAGQAPQVFVHHRRRKTVVSPCRRLRTPYPEGSGTG